MNKQEIILKFKMVEKEIEVNGKECNLDDLPYVLSIVLQSYAYEKVKKFLEVTQVRYEAIHNGFLELKSRDDI